MWYPKKFLMLEQVYAVTCCCVQAFNLLMCRLLMEVISYNFTTFYEFYRLGCGVVKACTLGVWALVFDFITSEAA